MFVATLSLVLHQQIREQENRLAQETETRKIVVETSTISDGMVSGALSLFRYIQLSQDEATIAPYFNSRDNLEVAIRELRQAFAGRSAEAQIIDRLETRLQFFIRSGDEVISLVRMGDGPDLAPGRLMEILDELRAFPFDSVSDAFTELMQMHKARMLHENETFESGIKFMIIGAMFACCGITLGTAWYLNEDITSRLKVMLANYARLGKSEPLLRSVGGTDEIADLDEKFHEVAASIESARRSERVILVNAAAALFTLDESLRFTEVSPSACLLWNVDAKRLLGQSFTSFASEVGSANLEDAFLKSQASDQTVEVMWEKASLPMLLTVHWSSPDHKFYCIGKDIRQLKQAELQLQESELMVRTLIERLPAAITISDSNGIVNFANLRACSLFHFDAEALKASRIRLADSVSTAQSGLRLGNTRAEAISTESGEGSLPSAPFLVGKDSRWSQISFANGKTYDVSSRTLADKNNSILTIFIDVTERFEIQAIKQDLIQSITTDIAQPLQDLQKCLEQLENGKFGTLSEKGQQRAAIAAAESRRVAQLFKDFIQLEVSGIAPLAITKVSINIDSVVKDSINAVATRGTARQITIEQLGEPVDDVMADPERMKQVIVNLLTNAIKFSPSGGKITVSVALDKNEVRIEVSDQGKGIPDGIKDTIFQPFAQASSEDATLRGGTGLGLAICRTIVERHGGSIGVKDNAQGPGACFWLRLPVSDH